MLLCVQQKEYVSCNGTQAGKNAVKLTAKNTQMFVREGESKENLQSARKVETILCSPTQALL